MVARSLTARRLLLPVNDISRDRPVRLRNRLPVRGILSIVNVAPWMPVDRKCLFAVDVASLVQDANHNSHLDHEVLIRHDTKHVIDRAGLPNPGQAFVHSPRRNLLHSWPKVMIQKVATERRMAGTINVVTIGRNANHAVTGAESGWEKVFMFVPFEAYRFGGI